MVYGKHGLDASASTASRLFIPKRPWRSMGPLPERACKPYDTNPIRARISQNSMASGRPDELARLSFYCAGRRSQDIAEALNKERIDGQGGRRRRQPAVVAAEVVQAATTSSNCSRC